MISQIIVTTSLEQTYTQNITIGYKITWDYPISYNISVNGNLLIEDLTTKMFPSE